MTPLAVLMYPIALIAQWSSFNSGLFLFGVKTFTKPGFLMKVQLKQNLRHKSF